MKETELRIEGIGFPQFSTRQATERIEPIHSSIFERTINGELLDLVPESHRKFRITIRCREQHAPTFFQTGIGAEVKVHPLSIFWEHHNLVHLKPRLKMSLGSRDIRVQNKMRNGEERLFQADDMSCIDLSGFAKIGDDVFFGYHPSLRMKIVRFSYETEEWSLQDPVNWSLTLEEI